MSPPSWHDRHPTLAEPVVDPAPQEPRRPAPGKVARTTRLGASRAAVQAQLAAILDPGRSMLIGHGDRAVQRQANGGERAPSSRRYNLPLQLVSFGPLPASAAGQLAHAQRVYGELGITLVPITLQLPSPPRPTPGTPADHLLDREEQRHGTDGARPARALDQQGARPFRPGDTDRRPVASQELRDLLHQRVRRNQIAVYWIETEIRDDPSQPGGGVDAMTYDHDFWDGVRADEEGIVLTGAAAADVLSHELGHLLMRIGHNDQNTAEERANPDMDDTRPDPNNVMARGGTRTGSQFTPEQLARLYRSRYLIASDGAAETGAPPVQRAAAEDSTPWLDAEQVQAAAAFGVAGAAGQLPFADAICASFGRHDVSGVRAAVGGAAADASEALGAHAYATGDRIAFARPPDLHLAAHEAAHVVQQRHGVHLSDGIGRAGDAYERHADEVADAVVRGESAEPLLDRHAGGGASGPAVQRNPGDTCETEADATAVACDPEREREAEAVAALRDAVPEVVRLEPALRDYDAALTAEARTRFRVPERGWTDTRASDGVSRRIDLSRSLDDIVARIESDPTVVAHIRETLDAFYNDPDERSRLRPEDIDLPLVLAIASRESAGRDIFLSTSSRRVVTAGRDTHRDGVGGLDYAGDLREEFPSSVREHVTEVQDDPGLRAGLRPNRASANPAEVRERDLLAAYIVEVHHREERFERLFHRSFHALPEAQQAALLARLGPDARRAWTQASFGSRLPQMLSEVRERFLRAMRADGFDAAVADDQVNLNAIISDDRVPDAAGLSGHRTRVTAAEAWMLEQALPPDLAAGSDEPASPAPDDGVADEAVPDDGVPESLRR
jgi:hypothetical protein